MDTLTHAQRMNCHDISPSGLWPVELKNTVVTKLKKKIKIYKKIISDMTEGMMKMEAPVHLKQLLYIKFLNL